MIPKRKALEIVKVLATMFSIESMPVKKTLGVHRIDRNIPFSKAPLKDPDGERACRSPGHKGLDERKAWKILDSPEGHRPDSDVDIFIMQLRDGSRERGGDIGQPARLDNRKNLRGQKENRNRRIHDR